MEIFIDLKGLRTKQEVLTKLGEVFEFGGPGPEANVPVVGALDGKGWGMNWDAFNDSLRHLEKSGICSNITLWITSIICMSNYFYTNDFLPFFYGSF